MCFALVMLMLDNTVVNVELPSIPARSATHRCQGSTWTIKRLHAGRSRCGWSRRSVAATSSAVARVPGSGSSFSPVAPRDRLRRKRGDARHVRAGPGRRNRRHDDGDASIHTRRFRRARGMGRSDGAAQQRGARDGPVLGGFLTESVSWGRFFINRRIAAITHVLVNAVRDAGDPRRDGRAGPSTTPG